MKRHNSSRPSLFISCCLSLILTFGSAYADVAVAQKQPVAQKPPVAKQQPKAKTKIEPRQSAADIINVAASKTPPSPRTPNVGQAIVPSDAPAAHDANDPLKMGLDAFAKDCILKMNRQRKPGINHKEVHTQPDGTYIARYMAVDPDSLITKYNPTKASNKEIKYIGILDYHEVEYVCIGKNKQQALAGPFNETNRTPVTELVKYKTKTKKWSY